MTQALAAFAALVSAFGAAFLFVAEPAAAKAILPQLGGGPAAWGATLLFFQLVLILGYGTVDAALRTGGPARVRLTHLAVFGAAAILLTVGGPFARHAAPAPATISTALRTLITQLGLPVLALTLTAPAVQTRMMGEPRGGRAVYSLYAASNAGSLIGLLAYPWLVEPRLPLSTQWAMWRVGIWILGGAVALLWLRAPVSTARQQSVRPDDDAPPGVLRALWVARAAIPAALLAGVTEYCTRDIAPVPLLWVLPLALYLLTWIVAFSPRARWLVRWAGQAQDIAAVLALVLFLNQPYALVGPALALLALVIVGISQHGALAESAPAPGWLGRFYVLLAVGGSIGTALVVVVGPTLFPVPVETGLALVAAVALGRPGGSLWTPAGRRRFLAFAALATAVPFLGGLTRTAVLGSLSIAAGTLAMRWRSRPHRVAMVLLVMVVADTTIRLTAPDLVGASHGVLGRFTARRDSTGTRLISGSTEHGLEPPTAPGARPEAALYYARRGPYGDLVALMGTRGPGWRFGVVGLGIGSLACTAPPGTRMTFFELNPGVLRLARDSTLFRTLRDCAPAAKVELGDARLTLARSAERFDLLTLDAFNSDAIPTHLLTREALALYRERVEPGGVIAFHVSNRFLDLAPVIAGVAKEAGWVMVEARRLPADVHPPAGIPAAVTMDLVALAADSATLRPLVASGRWRWAERFGRPWTDDWTPLASALTLSRGNVFGR